MEQALEESKGKLTRFIHRLHQQFNEEEIEKLDQKVIPSIVRRKARNDDITDFYLSTSIDERKLQMQEIQKCGEMSELVESPQETQVVQVQRPLPIQRHVSSMDKQKQVANITSSKSPEYPAKRVTNGSSIQDKLEKIKNIKKNKYYHCHIC